VTDQRLDGGGLADAAQRVDALKSTMRELRAITVDAGVRIDRADATLAEAREFTRTRRRRATRSARPRQGHS
jgi:hypothetical protein